jgi:hypothetical protein
MALSTLGLTYSRRDVDGHNSVAQLLFLLVWDGVGDHQVLQLTVVDLVDRVAAEDTVCDNRDGRCCAVLDDNVGCFAQCAASVCHVVHDDRNAALHVTDQDHATDFVRSGALLVDEGELGVEVVGDCSRSEWLVSKGILDLTLAPGYALPLRSSSIGRDDHTVLGGQVLADPSKGTGFRIEVVHRDVEEALDLTGVQVHCDDMIAAGGLQHVCHELGCDRSPTLILLILTGVREVGEDGGNAARRGSAASVDEDEELHYVVVDAVRLGRLDDEDCARSVSLDPCLSHVMPMIAYHPRRAHSRRWRCCFHCSSTAAP